MVENYWRRIWIGKNQFVSFPTLYVPNDYALSFKATEWLSTLSFRLLILETYKNARTFIKGIARRPELRNILPDAWKKNIENWGNEGVKPWSFALEVEERIEKIKDEKVKAFTENAVESFMDSCQESMIAISYAV